MIEEEKYEEKYERNLGPEGKPVSNGIRRREMALSVYAKIKLKRSITLLCFCLLYAAAKPQNREN